MAWVVLRVPVCVVALAPERLVECRSCHGLGGVAAEVVEPAPAVAIGRGALDPGGPAHAAGGAPALGLLVAFPALAFDGATGHRSAFPWLVGSAAARWLAAPTWGVGISSARAHHPAGVASQRARHLPWFPPPQK